MANQNSITRACNMVFVPLNKLHGMTNKGYCVPIIKQDIYCDMPPLTTKEDECLQLLVRGYNVKNIADKMGVSERRVQTLLKSLRDKFEVNTDHWIVSKYYQLGMDYQPTNE